MSQAHARALTVEPESHIQDAPSRRPTKQARRRRRVDPAWLVSIGAVVVLVTALAHVAQRAEIAVLTYELQKENLRLAQAERTRNHLLVEVTKARSLSDIEADARNRLGMVDPDNVKWLTMTGDHGPATETSEASYSNPRWPLVSALSTWYHRVRSELSNGP